MTQDPFREYIRQQEPGRQEKGYAWYTAIGLQAVDQLETWEYLRETARKNIEGEITLAEAKQLLDSYYEERPKHKKDDRTEEADKVSVRIVELLAEQAFSYKGLSMDEIIRHLAYFVSRLWQIHIFSEGNTRTTAVFFIKYLKTLGFDAANESFAEHAWYFRNALVRANYNDLKNGVHETMEYLELFLKNLLLDEKMN